MRDESFVDSLLKTLCCPYQFVLTHSFFLLESWLITSMSFNGKDLMGGIGIRKILKQNI